VHLSALRLLSVDEVPVDTETVEDGYDVTDPSLGLAALLGEAERAAARQRAALEAARVALVMRTAPRCTRIGGDRLRMRIGEMITDTRYEWLSVEPTAQAVGVGTGWPAHVRVRRVVAHDAAHAARVEARYQSQVRPWPGPLPFVVATDRAVVLAGDDTGAWELTEPGAVHLTVSLFDQLWTAAQPVTGPLEDLSDNERDVLQLMVLGYTDDAVARQLGCSLRTVRRTTASLMRRLDARSRFQAGVNACRRGWL
jgi:DNA-binding CsgD family transcriptional regulator